MGTIQGIARSIRLAAFIAVNMRRQLVGNGLDWWQQEEREVRAMRAERTGRAYRLAG